MLHMVNLSCHLALQAAAGREVEVGVQEAEGEGAVAEQPGQRQQPPPPGASPSCRGQVRYTGEMVNIRCSIVNCAGIPNSCLCTVL